MENPKGSSAVAIIITIVLTAIVVGSISYYLSNAKSKQLEQKNSQTDDKVEAATSTVAVDSEKECFSKYEIVNFVKNVNHNISFNYPCGWNLRNPGGDTVIASSPDEKASFQWPVPDFGLHDMKLTKEFTVKINGNDYSAKKYEGNGQVIEIINVPVPNEVGYSGFMLSYKDSSYRDELAQILSSIKF